MSFDVGSWVAALGVQVLAVLPGAPNVPGPPDEFCDASPSKVDAMLDAQASGIALGYRTRPATPDLGFYAASTACLSRCRKTRLEIASCMSNLNRFLDGNCQSASPADRDRVLGADISDREYVAEMKKMFGGEMMTIPKEILDAGAKYLGLGDFARAIERLGLKYISYGSSLLDAPRTSGSSRAARSRTTSTSGRRSPRPDRRTSRSSIRRTTDRRSARSIRRDGSTRSRRGARRGFRLIDSARSPTR